MRHLGTPSSFKCSMLLELEGLWWAVIESLVIYGLSSPLLDTTHAPLDFTLRE